jgi:hypothetical protein
MRRPKEKDVVLRGDQLLCRGDIITLMDEGAPTKCKVLSCLGTDSGSCIASMEYIEGPKKGKRLETSLVAKEQKVS